MGKHPIWSGRALADPLHAFPDMDATLVASLLATLSDIVLVLDRDGCITDAAVRDGVCPEPVHESWIGQRFLATVTTESRAKVERLLSGAALSERFEINHPVPGEDDLPVRYTVILLPQGGRRLAFGHDLRAVHDLQQQIVAQQLSFEHEGERLRAVSAQYRLLFEVSNAVHMIVDPATRKIVESNAAAAAMLKGRSVAADGLRLERLFSEAALEDLDAALSSAQSTGRVERVSLAWRWMPEEPVDAQIRYFRSARVPLVSLQVERGREGAADSVQSELLARLGRETPDAVALLDADLKIVFANDSLLDLLNLVSPEQALDHSLEEWVGRPNVDLKTMKEAIDRQGAVRELGTSVQPVDGDPIPVRISGAAIEERGRRLYGLTIRWGEDGVARSDPAKAALRPTDELVGLIGQMSLREIVRDSADVIESLCIEAALSLTDNNRASAAELLGLSRQALYTKLHRYGFISDETGDDLQDETKPSVKST